MPRISSSKRVFNIKHFTLIFIDKHACSEIICLMYWKKIVDVQRSKSRIVNVFTFVVFSPGFSFFCLWNPWSSTPFCACEQIVNTVKQAVQPRSCKCWNYLQRWSGSLALKRANKNGRWSANDEIMSRSGNPLTRRYLSISKLYRFSFRNSPCLRFL